MFRKLLFISLAWAVLILFISGMPGDQIPQSRLWMIPQFDKIVHMGLYFPLGFFLAAEFRLSHHLVLRRYATVFTLLLVAIYGGLIEIGQDYLFVNRSADWWDFLSDILGGFLGILAFQYVGYPIYQKFRKN